MGEKREIIEVDWQQFIIENRSKLLAISRKSCGIFNLPQEFAEDAVQDSLIKATAAAIEYRGPNSVMNYVCKIIRNICVDKCRRKKLLTAMPTSSDESSPVDRLPDDRLLPDDALVALEDQEQRKHEEFLMFLGFSFLPAYTSKGDESLRENLDMLWQHVVENKSYRDLADEHGISEQLCRKRVERTKKVLDGWVCALSGALPNDDGDSSWRRGYEAGKKAKESKLYWVSKKSKGNNNAKS